MAETTIAIAVERAVHDAFIRLAEKVYKDHGIMVDSINIQWLDVSTMEELHHLVASIKAETSSRGRRR